MVPVHHLSTRANCPLAAARQRLIDATGIEAPTPSADGMIWPVRRDLMCCHDAIRVRLAEDIITVWRDNNGHLQDGDLIRLGWSVDDNDTRRLAWRVRRFLEPAAKLASDARPDLIGEASAAIRRKAA